MTHVRLRHTLGKVFACAILFLFLGTIFLTHDAFADDYTLTPLSVTKVSGSDGDVSKSSSKKQLKINLYLEDAGTTTKVYTLTLKNNWTADAKYAYRLANSTNITLSATGKLIAKHSTYYNGESEDVTASLSLASGTTSVNTKKDSHGNYSVAYIPLSITLPKGYIYYGQVDNKN